MNQNFITSKLFFLIGEPKNLLIVLEIVFKKQPPMQIQHKRQEQDGAFYIQKNDDVLAEMTYHMNGKNTMVVDHTEVDESLRGRNIGFELVKEGVEYARREGLKIIPVCKFAKSVFDRKEELRDVLE